MIIDSPYIREGKLHRLDTGSYLPWALISLVVAVTSLDIFCAYKVSCSLLVMLFLQIYLVVVLLVTSELSTCVDSTGMFHHSLSSSGVLYSG